MSKAKRILSILLAMVLMITSFPVLPVEAAENSESTTIIVESVGAKPGDLVDVDVTIENNPGILGAVLKLTYDKALTLESVTEGEAFSELEMTKPGSFAYTGCSFGWDGMEPTDMDGVIMTLTFRVSETAVKSEKLNVSVSCKAGDIFDVNSKNIDVAITNGRVIVIDYIPGDLNTDNAVNMKDVVALRRYIVGDDVVINEPAADVNDDGSAGMKDVVQIRQHIVGGYGVVLMPSTKICDHVMEHTVYKAPTCTEAGNTEYYYCALCERYFADENGTKELTEDQLVMPALGHTVVIDEAVAPTYTSSGWTEGSHCSVCNEVIVEQQEVPMLEAATHSISYRNLQGADTPEPTSYKETEGLLEMPVPVRAGYEFIGWYNASVGGNVVDYIQAGSTKDYILYARWKVEEYSITYREAPVNNNPTTYTVESSIIILEDPEWSGLKFTGWTDASGKVYKEIPKGSIGDLELTANWALQRNIASAGGKDIIASTYSQVSDTYYFIYELGVIEHVVLDELSSGASFVLAHTKGDPDTEISLEESVTIEKSVADSIATTISESVSNSTEWSKTVEEAKERSHEAHADLTLGMEIGTDLSIVKGSIEASAGYATTWVSSSSDSTTEGKSTETENGIEQESSSTITYLDSITSTLSTSVSIASSMPTGYYTYVHAGNVRVFGVVAYKADESNFYLTTYSILDNMHGMLLYYPNVELLNKPTCETLEYNIPTEKIFEMVENSYFVEYDANGGEGEMDRSVHAVGGQQTLLSNAFTRTGYSFAGWLHMDENGEPAYIYQDDQAVLDIAEGREVLTLYAKWEPHHYGIAYNANTPAGASTVVENMPASTMCEYDADVTLAEKVPTLTGYTFGGWYLDAECTEKVGDANQTLTKPNFTTENNGAVTVYAKWVPNVYNLIYNFNGGTADAAGKQVTFDSMYGEFAVPTRAQYKFKGWTLNGQLLNANDYVRIPEDHTIDAQWLRTASTVQFRPGHSGEIRVTEDDKVYEEISPDFNRDALLAEGYNRIKLVLTFYVREVNDGYQDLWIYSDNLGVKHTQKTDMETSDKDSWHKHEYTFWLNLANLETDAGFKLEWGANGSGKDTWRLGETTLQMTAEYVPEGA